MSYMYFTNTKNSAIVSIVKVFNGLGGKEHGKNAVRKRCRDYKGDYCNR